MKIFQYTTQFYTNTAYFTDIEITFSFCFIINILPQRFTINIFFDNADTIIIFSNILFNIINYRNVGMFQILNKMGFIQKSLRFFMTARKYLGYTIYIKYNMPYKINCRMIGTCKFLNDFIFLVKLVIHLLLRRYMKNIS